MFWWTLIGVNGCLMGYKRKTIYKLVLRDHKPPILWRINLWCHRAWLANPGTKWRCAKQNSQGMHSSQHFAASAFFACSPWRLTPYSTSQQITFSTSFSSMSTSIESCQSRWRGGRRPKVFGYALVSRGWNMVTQIGHMSCHASISSASSNKTCSSKRQQLIMPASCC